MRRRSVLVSLPNSFIAGKLGELVESARVGEQELELSVGDAVLPPEADGLVLLLGDGNVCCMPALQLFRLLKLFDLPLEPGRGFVGSLTRRLIGVMLSHNGVGCGLRNFAGGFFGGDSFFIPGPDHLIYSAAINSADFRKASGHSFSNFSVTASRIKSLRDFNGIKFWQRHAKASWVRRSA
jgi:hypothetical protein